MNRYTEMSGMDLNRTRVTKTANLLHELERSLRSCGCLLGSGKSWSVSWGCKMRRPGIEPGPPAWKADILPLNYRRGYIA